MFTITWAFFENTCRRQTAGRRGEASKPLGFGIGMALIAAAGCSDTTAPREEVQVGFTAAITGGTTRQLAGTAIFDPDVPGFGLSLVQASGLGGENGVRHAVYFRRPLGGVPTPNEYAIALETGDDDDITAGVVLDGDGNDPLLCEATSGTLRVMSVSTTHVRGRFTMTALCSHVDGDDAPIPIEVSGNFVATKGSIEEPDESIQVAGSTYILSTVDGSAVPYLLRDYTDPDGVRGRKWLVADTIQFSPDGQLGFTRIYRHQEESAGAPADEWEYDNWIGGYFRQSAANVAVAWGYVTPPTEVQYGDTLQLRGHVLVRIAHLPPGCLACPIGPEVEFVYVRRAASGND